MTRGNAGIYQIWKVMCINCIIFFFNCMAYTRLQQKWKHNYFSFLIFFLLLIFFYLSIFRISFNNILINNLCNSLLLMGTVYEFIFIYVCHYKFNREIRFRKIKIYSVCQFVFANKYILCRNLVITVNKNSMLPRSNL